MSPLTEAQRRCLSVALHQIERELAWIAEFIVRPAPILMFPFIDDLNRHTRRRLGHTIAEAGLAERLDPKAQRLTDLLVDMFRLAGGQAVAAVAQSDP
jgi:hypothetical protein